MNTDQLRDEYESTMTSDQLWVLSYWAECERRGEEPVSIPAQELASGWENQQLIDQLEDRKTPSFATQQDYYRDMLTRRIQAHIASWETESA